MYMRIFLCIPYRNWQHSTLVFFRAFHMSSLSVFCSFPVLWGNRFRQVMWLAQCDIVRERAGFELKSLTSHTMCLHPQLLSCDSLWPHGLYVAHQAPLCMGFSRQEYWSALRFPFPGDLPRDQNCISCIGGFFTTEPTGKHPLLPILHFPSYCVLGSCLLLVISYASIDSPALSE